MFGRTRREETHGVYGPYYEKARDCWRVSVDPGKGGGYSTYCKSKAEGEDLVKNLREQRCKAQKIKDIRDGYLEYLSRVRARKARSVETSEDAINRFFLGKLGEPIKVLTERFCQKMYDELTKRVSVATHRNSLKEVRSFGVWLVKQRYLTENPLQEIEPIGRIRRGKPQLRVNEARLWMKEALRLWEEEKVEGALAALTTLLLGVRVSELLNRKVRDLDDDGKLFWVGEFGEDDTKTENSRRRLEVPEMLRPHLLEVAKGKDPEEPLWNYRSDQWVLRTVKDICARAGVPTIVTHSLRGLHATLADAAGVSSHLVTLALGHTSAEIRQQHYTSPEAWGAAKQARALNVLEGGMSQVAKKS